MRAAIIALALSLSGCAVAPDKLIGGIDHTSHILQHFEHEGDGGNEGCTGPMLGLRWEGPHYYVQASDMYCTQGRIDLQREVANLQAGVSVDLK
jgi:hypothetical protein